MVCFSSNLLAYRPRSSAINERVAGECYAVKGQIIHVGYRCQHHQRILYSPVKQGFATVMNTVARPAIAAQIGGAYKRSAEV